MQDPPNFPQDLNSAVDPGFITNLDVARDLVAQDSSSHQLPSFTLNSNLERKNFNSAAISDAPPAPAFAQDPNVPDLASSLPISVRSSTVQDPELLRPIFSQGPKSTVDPGFLPNLNVARDLVIPDPNFKQKPRFSFDPNLGYTNEQGNFNR